MELKDALHRTVGTGGNCISANRSIADCIRYLQPLSHISYADMIQPNYCLHEFLTLRVYEPPREYCLNGKGCSACDKYRNFSFNKEFGEEKKKVINEFNGLCLDCVSTGRESFRTNQCRIKHAVQNKSITYGWERQGGKGPSSRRAVKWMVQNSYIFCLNHDVGRWHVRTITYILVNSTSNNAGYYPKQLFSLTTAHQTADIVDWSRMTASRELVWGSRLDDEEGKRYVQIPNRIICTLNAWASRLQYLYVPTCTIREVSGYGMAVVPIEIPTIDSNKPLQTHASQDPT